MSAGGVALAALVALATAVVLALVGHQKLLPRIVIRHTRKTMGLHQLREPSVEDGAGTSDIHYLSTAFDCRGRDLVIEGRAPRAAYWQIGAYDPWLRAVSGGHINHRTTTLDANGHFRIVVTARDHGGPNTLRCGESPLGVLIFRTLLASEPVSVPTIREEPWQRTGGAFAEASLESATISRVTEGSRT